MSHQICVVDGIYRPVIEEKYLESFVETGFLLRDNLDTGIQIPDTVYHFGQYKNASEHNKATLVHGENNIRSFFNAYESMPNRDEFFKINTTRFNIVPVAGSKPKTGVASNFEVYLGTAKDNILDQERKSFIKIPGVEDKRSWQRDIFIGHTVLRSNTERQKFIDALKDYIPAQLTVGKLAIAHRIVNV